MEKKMKNTPALLDLADLSEKEIAEMPIDMISYYYDHEKEQSNMLKKIKGLLDAAILVKYDNKLSLETFGTHNTNDDDYQVKVSIGKSVSYDGEKLKAVKETIKNIWNADPDEYIDTELSVSESKFKAWPKATQELFMDARTVKPSKPKIKIKHKEEK